MYSIHLKSEDDFEGWRNGARLAVSAGLAVEDVEFTVGENASDLFSDGDLQSSGATNFPFTKDKGPRAPKHFLQLARQVVCHTNSQRFMLLYRLLKRAQTDKSLFLRTTDPDVYLANALAKEVRRDLHKMKAFVRFRKVETPENNLENFVAWFEPTHHIVELGSGFFVRRFTNMRWSILTPLKCVHWDGSSLTFSGGVAKSKAPHGDALEDYWRTYYKAIFNPARLKISAMTSEMPKKYWRNLPEAELIPELIKSSRERQEAMVDRLPGMPNPKLMAHREVKANHHNEQADEFTNLDQLNQGLIACRSCELWQNATQAVCGSGPPDAALVLVGEQPGDVEDLKGEPFVGPAGQLLREMMLQSGLDPKTTYLTNAVKHFRFEPRGKRRIHKSPSTGHIQHCSWWLQKELDIIKPKIVVALGATAARSITGQPLRIAESRGRFIQTNSLTKMMITRHPSSILRIKQPAEQERARSELLHDLTMVALELRQIGSSKDSRSSQSG